MLDIYPESDDRCVAINKGSGKGPKKRCGNCGKTGKANLDEAGRLLDKMDRTESLTKCRRNFDDLAFLTMCGRWHRNMPEIRAERCRHWNNEVDVYVAAAEARRAARALKSKEALKARKAEEEAAAELENEERVRVV